VVFLPAGAATRQQGTGTWTLDEGLNAPVSTSVLAGALVVDSTLTTPVVNVQAGASLAGLGTVTGAVVNSPCRQRGVVSQQFEVDRSDSGPWLKKDSAAEDIRRTEKPGPI